MTVIHRYTNDYPRISKMISDDVSFVWIAYEKNSDGICHLQKVSAHALDQVYFDLEIEAEEIVDMEIKDGFIYLLFNNDSTYIAKRFSTTAPITSNVSYTLPVGLLEQPVALTHTSDGYLNILTPGNSSATNALIYRFDDDFDNLSEIIAVRVGNIRIIEARDIVADDDDNMWIVTYTDPVKLIRMWFQSGDIWSFAFVNIV